MNSTRLFALVMDVKDVYARRKDALKTLRAPKPNMDGQWTETELQGLLAQFRAQPGHAFLQRTARANGNLVPLVLGLVRSAAEGAADGAVAEALWDALARALGGPKK